MNAESNKMVDYAAIGEYYDQAHFIREFKNLVGVTPKERARVGSQAGEHVFLVVETDDCLRDYNRMKERGISFVSEPKHVPWGIEAVFEDLYGNQLDLLQPIRQ